MKRALIVFALISFSVYRR